MNIKYSDSLELYSKEMDKILSKDILSVGILMIVMDSAVSHHITPKSAIAAQFGVDLVSVKAVLYIFHYF